MSASLFIPFVALKDFFPCVSHLLLLPLLVLLCFVFLCVFITLSFIVSCQFSCCPSSQLCIHVTHLFVFLSMYKYYSEDVFHLLLFSEKSFVLPVGLIRVYFSSSSCVWTLHQALSG